MNSIDKNVKRENLYSLLGDLPDRNRPVSGEYICEKDCGTYTLETYILDLNGIELVPAFIAKPKNATGKLPCMIYNHYHGGKYHIGKNEFVTDDRPYIYGEPYSKVLTDLGYIAVCIDCWNFGERSGRDEGELFKEMLWKGQVLWGMMVYDYLRSVDYVLTRDDVDASRIGTMGLSLGSTAAWWLAALDERIKVTVDLCCATDFEELINIRNLNGHGIYYYVPALLKHFTASDIMALIAPRKRFSLNGKYDALTPLKGLHKIDENMKEVYTGYGKPENWRMMIDNCGHMETAQMRTEIIKFLKDNL